MRFSSSTIKLFAAGPLTLPLSRSGERGLRLDAPDANSSDGT